MIPVRQLAIDGLNKVLHASAKADVVFHAALEQIKDADRGLLHEFLYGVLRRFYSLEADYSRFCKSKPEPQVQCALLLGTYQIRHMRIPAHAAVSETVDAIAYSQPKAKGYVNAVLRRVSESEEPKRLKPHQRNELPKWMYAEWRDAFGADAVSCFSEALKQPPALCLAVFMDRQAWIEQAISCGFEAIAGDLSPYAVLLPSGTDVCALPGYEEGDFTVMDQAAQHAVLALPVHHPEGLIVDLCAAPGGKTALLSKRFPEARIVAVELNQRRMQRLNENLQRLNCANVSVICADAGALPFADQSVDALMLDAPCSASGILRRHPDAKFLHDQDDVEQLAAGQKRLLGQALRLLNEQASMVYAVCSIHPEENEQVVAGMQCLQSQRLLPAWEHDGFFHAVIQASDIRKTT